MIPTEVNTEPLTRDQVAAMVRRGLDDPVVPHFHAHWYRQKTTWAMTRYKGVPILKAATDLQTYHEMIWALRPNVIIETGSCFGGSALWFADQLDQLQDTEESMVFSVDTEQRMVGNPWPEPAHPNIQWVHGDSTDPVKAFGIKSQIPDGARVMVSLDSDHAERHVAKELLLYAPMVTCGQYLVVEDTNISGRPMRVDPDERGRVDGGPGAAVDAFLSTELGKEFEPDIVCERQLLTMHPGGWLRRG